MLWLAVRNLLVQRNICSYGRGVAYTDVVITGFNYISVFLKIEHLLRTLIKFVEKRKKLNNKLWSSSFLYSVGTNMILWYKQSNGEEI